MDSVVGFPLIINGPYVGDGEKKGGWQVMIRQGLTRPVGPERKHIKVIVQRDTETTATLF